jgi:hypothetical protein
MRMQRWWNSVLLWWKDQGRRCEVLLQVSGRTECPDQKECSRTLKERGQMSPVGVASRCAAARLSCY